jgi:peptide/nickel transport system ATP-binding protein
MHPYTRGLLNSLPINDSKQKLEPIPGEVPHPTNLPKGCTFNPRCKDVLPICQKQSPDLKSIHLKKHRTACWLYDNSLKDN